MEMQYIKVSWTHSLNSEPVLLYSELDEKRFEVRKVEIYSDGRCDYADASGSLGETRLSTEALPLISDIDRDIQFESAAITQEEFERVWSKSHC